jgi:two-component system, OmpR family, response regulator QseB
VSASILVVEDDAGIRRVVDRGLRLAGHELVFAEDLASARARWRDDGFDLVLLDVMLPDGDGIELLAERRAAGDATPVVLLSAREEAELRERASAAGATAYLPKPFAYGELLACVEALAGGQA